MKIVLKFFLLFLFTPATSYADFQPDVIDFESEITVASWLFPESPLYNGQKHNNSSIAFESELYAEWSKGDNIVFTPFILFDNQDSRRVPRHRC